ncbi:hypothetical protein FB567DRAFT_92379 [Paraphoma chrysanthemicola]|uniref:Uncharacterized protein n=1 Tax=Paraphoma chrysanthemicola TaxID=798071 RepID=A0A8K0VWI5_9PLEO|nr:hypothetical protein FB567DRAFT_92379 [Paraphoma chrysanthemicola]
MPFAILPTIPKEAKLRMHLKDTLDDLPNNLPQYNEPRLLDDLTFLLRSPLFLYTISPRLTNPVTRGTPEPLTPTSMTSDADFDKPDSAFDVSYLKIRIKWEDDSWAAQLVYGNNVLLEGRQLDIEQELGFMQSFWWFCEEASFLAYEFKAREDAAMVRRGGKVDVEGVTEEGRLENGVDGWVTPRRSKAGEKRRSLKLKIRFRDTARGPAGVWRVW